MATSHLFHRASSYRKESGTRRWLASACALGLLAAAPAAGADGPPARPAVRAAPAATPTPPDPLPRDTALLAARRLTLPVQGVTPEALADTFRAARSAGRRHDAIDILAPAGTPVLAVEDGRIAKLFLSQPGGITIYQFDPSGRYSYYYAHLQGYAPGLREGQQVRRGQVIGYVGSTGNARGGAPHLHFAIARLPPDRAWWKGDALNPYPVLRKP